MSWDHPLDPPIRPVTNWPKHEVNLRLIEKLDDCPQLYKPQDAPTYPADIIEFCDRLHDDGHVELGLLVLSQYTKLVRLMAFSKFMLEAGK